MKRTLIWDLFIEILTSKPDALNHYVHYLEQVNDVDQLTTIYKYACYFDFYRRPKSIRNFILKESKESI
jgi:hypothetical protein